MHALSCSVKPLPHLVDLGKVPPATQPAMDGSAITLAQAEVRMQFLKGAHRGRDIAAMPVQKIEVAKAMPSQRLHVVDDDLDQRRRPQRYSARKPRLNWAGPRLSVGPTSAPDSSPMACAMDSAVKLSVPIMPVGPCCSVEPVGITTPCDVWR